MNILSEINSAAKQAVSTLYGQDVPEKMVQLQKTKKEFEGSLTLVVFPFLKISKKKPEDTAQEIGEWLKQNCKAVADYNVVKGFLNLVNRRHKGKASSLRLACRCCSSSCSSSSRSRSSTCSTRSAR